MERHKPWLAFLLNFVLPGAGFVYLRRWKQSVVNFVLVQSALLFLLFVVGEPTLVEHIHYVFLALAAASGGYAHGVAVTLNKSTRAEMTPTTSSSLAER